VQSLQCRDFWLDLARVYWPKGSHTRLHALLNLIQFEVIGHGRGWWVVWYRLLPRRCIRTTCIWAWMCCCWCSSTWVPRRARCLLIRLKLSSPYSTSNPGPAPPCFAQPLIRLALHLSLFGLLSATTPLPLRYHSCPCAATRVWAPCWRDDICR